MEFVDYYKILNIAKTATQDEVKNAYRKLARKHHPDLNPTDKDANKKFQQINEANEVLSDPEKRKKYDTYGKDWQHAEAYEQAKKERGGQQYRQSAGANSYAAGDGDDEGYFSDFFESMFGQSGGRARNTQVKFKGKDYQAELRLTLKEAYTTHQQVLTVNENKVRITIPAGVENGQVIKLKGHGGLGVNGGPNGDLYITFAIENDTAFKRDGDTLYATVDLDLYTAVLGGEVTIDTLDGKLKLKVKPETQNGTKTRLKGKGFPVYKKEGEFGDLFVTYNVKIPTGLTEAQRELFTQLSKS